MIELPPSVFIYWITIPSMYLLLMIYSVFNLNDVSWGTREDAPQKPSEEEEKKKAEAKEKKSSRLVMAEFQLSVHLGNLTQ